MGGRHEITVYCDDSQLSYSKFQTEFNDGDALTFDDAYRLAHLPLIAPDHPRVIPSTPGSSYDMGIHDWVYSVAIPIPSDELLSSTTFARLYEQLKASSFANKLSWDTFNQRKDKLHATICGAMSTGKAPDIDEQAYHHLLACGPLPISVRGLFSGNINIGRLYLKIYPAAHDDKNVCHVIQAALGSPPTDLYLVGIFNFVEELNILETKDLNAILQSWRDIDFITLNIEHLWLLKSKDDLVLNSSIEQLIPLV